MRMFRQPWFIILLIITGIYTYTFYNSSKELKVSTSTAEAVNVKDNEDEDSAQKPVISVKISQEFLASRSLNFTLATYHNMKVKFNSTDSDKVIVSLIGEGNSYKNDGKRLADWYQVSSAGSTLLLKAHNNKGHRGFSALKKMAKSLKGDAEETRLTMIIEFPEGHVFKSVDIEGISNDLFATDLKFDSFSMATVSGDLRLKDCEGKSIKLETVSGDANIEANGIHQVDIASVSGDAFLKSTTSSPELQFESVSGDLSLNIPSDSKLDVNFESMSGDLINDFGASKDSGSKLRFSSLSGSATIHKIQ